MAYPEGTDALTPLQDVIKNAIAAALTMESTPYVPVLSATTTPPALGSGSTRQEGWWTSMGRRITGSAVFRFGTSGMSQGQGSYTVSLPVPAAFPPQQSGGLGIATPCGIATLRRNDPLGDSLPAVAYFTSSTTIVLVHPGGGNVNNVDPWPWASLDAIAVLFDYIAATAP